MRSIRRSALGVAPIIACLTQAAELPAPTGKHPIGRTSFHWFDSNTQSNGEPREVAALVWYPAASAGGPRAPYLPGAQDLASVAAMPNLFGPAWQAIASNVLPTYSYERAPIARGARLPVLIFSPGGGVPVAAYTAQLEDYASHGYVVIGVDHLFDSAAIVLPDRRIQTPKAPWQPVGSPEDNEKKRADRRAADIRLVVDQLSRMDTQPGSIFRSRLELKRVGVFGHSAGGRAAARACQTDVRIGACLNQDGNMAWHPFWLDDRGHSMNQPYMTLDHLDPDPPASVFKEMGTTREKYVARRSARQAEAKEKLYSTVAAGSYHVTIKTPGVSHNSFADIRQLGRLDGPGINAWPEEIRVATPNAHILGRIRQWTRAFFDKTVRQDDSPLAELERTPDPATEVRRYRRLTSAPAPPATPAAPASIKRP